MASLMGATGGFGQNRDAVRYLGDPARPQGMAGYFGQTPRPIDPSLVDPARPYQPPQGLAPSPWSQQQDNIPPEWRTQFTPQMLQDIRQRRAMIRAMPGWQPGQVSGLPQQPRPPIAGLLGVM